MAERKENIQLPKDWHDRKPLVYRITVDEKLDDNTIRLLVSPLVAGIEKYADKKTKVIVITDRQRNWEDERDLIVKRDNFEELLPIFGLMAENVKGFGWENIREGQVYLLGEVMQKKVKKRRNEGTDKDEVLTQFIVKPDEANFYRIDDEVSASIKRLYFSTLKGRRKHAVRD